MKIQTQSVAFAIVAAAAFTLGPAPTASASETFSSTPMGRWEITLRGGGKTTLMGVNLIEAPAYTGPVSSVVTGEFTLPNINPADILETGKYYAVVVATGANAGVNTIVTSWNSSSISVGDDLNGLVATGLDTVLLIKLPTIQEIFGIGGEVLMGGSFSNADRVTVSNALGEELLTLFYSTGGPTGTGWRAVGKGGQNFSNQPIYLTDGLAIQKISQGDVVLEIGGFVQTFPIALLVGSGSTAFATVFADDVTLSNGGFIRPAAPEISLSSGSFQTADRVVFDSNGDGSDEVFFYSSGGPAGVGWRLVGGGATSYGNVVLPAGFGIQNQGEPKTILREPAY